MQQAHRSSEPDSPWALADGWRLGHASYRVLGLAHRGERYELTCHGNARHYAIEWAGTQCRIEAGQFAGHRPSARIDGGVGRAKVRVRELQYVLSRVGAGSVKKNTKDN